jgi:uncharacterized protein (TIGR02266 family)
VKRQGGAPALGPALKFAIAPPLTGGMDPLPSPEAPESTTAGRRVHARAPMEVEVTVESDHNFFNGFSENVSEGGLFIATHVPRAVGQAVEVLFTLPGAPRPIRVDCVVCWVRPYSEGSGLPAGMGLRFVDLSPEDAQLVAGFVRAREPIFWD